MTTNTIDNDRTGKALTSDEITQWQQQMGNKISPEANRIYGDILRGNFGQGTTQTDHIKGIVCFLDFVQFFRIDSQIMVLPTNF